MALMKHRGTENTENSDASNVELCALCVSVFRSASIYKSPIPARFMIDALPERLVLIVGIQWLQVTEPNFNFNLNLNLNLNLN